MGGLQTLWKRANLSLYLTALPPSGAWQHSNYCSLFFLASLACINCLLPLGLELGNSLSKDTCAQSQVLPMWQLTHLMFYPPPSSFLPLNASTLKDSFDASSSLSLKTNHQLTLLLPSKYLFCSIYLPGPVIEWKEHGMCVSRMSAQIPAFPPAGLVKLSVSSSPSSSLNSSTSILFITWTAWWSSQDPPARGAVYTLPVPLPTLSPQVSCSQLPT